MCRKFKSNFITLVVPSCYPSHLMQTNARNPNGKGFYKNTCKRGWTRFETLQGWMMFQILKCGRPLKTLAWVQALEYIIPVCLCVKMLSSKLSDSILLHCLRNWANIFKMFLVIRRFSTFDSCCHFTKASKSYHMLV